MIDPDTFSAIVVPECDFIAAHDAARVAEWLTAQPHSLSVELAPGENDLATRLLWPLLATRHRCDLRALQLGDFVDTVLTWQCPVGIRCRLLARWWELAA
ncbi:MAG TPA: hypothetical protein VFA43_19300 [Gemmatimonadaceae bacterium]|nr:hypothetical protein [Gemmatimonadaceae bacterium]